MNAIFILISYYIFIDCNHITNLMYMCAWQWIISSGCLMGGWSVCFMFLWGDRDVKLDFFSTGFQNKSAGVTPKPPVICFPGLGSRIDQRASNELEMTNHWFFCSFGNVRWQIYSWSVFVLNGQATSSLMDHLWLIFQIRSIHAFYVMAATSPQKIGSDICSYFNLSVNLRYYSKRNWLLLAADLTSWDKTVIMTANKEEQAHIF